MCEAPWRYHSTRQVYCTLDAEVPAGRRLLVVLLLVLVLTLVPW